MTSKIYLYNHWGELEDTLEGVDTTPRSWTMNKYGQCDFTLALDNPKLTLRNLEFGNLIHIEHQPVLEEEEQTPGGKLPDWTGIILPPRTWGTDGCHVTAYSAEAILAYRAMPYVTVNDTPGNVFKKILDMANARTDLLPFTIGIGQVDDLVATFSDDLKLNAYDHINKLVSAVGMQWNVTGSIVPESYALALTANLKLKEPYDGAAQTILSPTRPRPGVIARLNPDNTDAKGTLLTEQGAPFNHIFAYSQSYTDADRIMQEVTYPLSISRYGLFQLNSVYTGVHDAATLTSTVTYRTGRDRRGQPSMLFTRTVIDGIDNVFDGLRVGNLVEVVEPRVGFNPRGGFGFQATARIESMKYSDKTNKVELNIEVIS